MSHKEFDVITELFSRSGEEVGNSLHFHQDNNVLYSINRLQSP